MTDPEETRNFDEGDSLTGDVSKSLGIPEGAVIIFNDGEFYPLARFSYGFVEKNGDHGPGFLKIGKGEAATQVQKEYMAIKLAQELGLPTPVAFDFKVTEKGHGTLYLARLSSEEGMLLVDDEMIAAADPSFGERSAHALLEATAKVIPQALFDEYSQYIKLNEGRVVSSSSLKDEFLKETAIVMDPQHNVLPNATLTKEDLEAIVGDFEVNVLPLIESADDSEKYYYYHGDTHPRNTFYPTDKSPEAILLDLEHTGATKNRVLAMIADFGDFYNRSWPNPEMQKAFVKSIFEGLSRENKDFAYLVTKAAIVVGTIHAAQLYMDETHPMHSKSVALLGNLKNNLNSLDLIYSEDNQIQ